MQQAMRHGLRFALSVLIFVSVGFVTGEVVLRLLPKSMVGDLGPSRLNVEFHEFGPWFTPNQEGSHTSSCYSVYPIEINNHGMRDRMRVLKNDPGVLRIAVLGDSYMEAVQVPDRKFTAALLEERLNRIDRPTEVLNFGFSGYGTAQELWLYRHKVRKFNPDLVLLFFLAGNDIQNNSMKLDYQSYGYDRDDYGSGVAVPFAYFDREGNQLINRPNVRFNSTVKRLAKQYILHRSYLVDFIYERYLYLRAYYGSISLTHSEESFTTDNGNSPGRVENNAAPVESDQTLDAAEIEDWAEAWKMTELILNTLDREVRTDGAKLAVVLIPAYGSGKHHQAVELVKNLAIPYLDLQTPMQVLMTERNLVDKDLSFSCDAHWNEAAHSMAAEVTAPWLESLINKL